MKKITLISLLILLPLLFSGCASMNKYSSSDTRFGSRNNLGLIEHDPIREASGMVASRNNAGVLWVHNDSGVPALYAVNTHGEHLGEYILDGCANSDWEDMTIASGAGLDRDYIYIGAIGDNRRRRETRSICRIIEPQVYADQQPVTRQINNVEVMNFRYPDGSHDAETLMADPLSGELYIISKRVRPAGIYRLPLAFSEKQLITADRLAELPYKYIVSGDISRTGMEILVKTYTAIFYWHRLPGESLQETFRRRPETVPYVWESGGEAVAWDAMGRGYYTVSEEYLGVAARLYFYPRLTDRRPDQTKGTGDQGQ